MKNGSDIRAERARKGVSQSWLAGKLGISVSTLRDIENDAVSIDAKEYTRIADILNAVQLQKAA